MSQRDGDRDGLSLSGSSQPVAKANRQTVSKSPATSTQSNFNTSGSGGSGGGNGPVSPASRRRRRRRNRNRNRRWRRRANRANDANPANQANRSLRLSAGLLSLKRNNYGHDHNGYNDEGSHYNPQDDYHDDHRDHNHHHGRFHHDYDDHDENHYNEDHHADEDNRDHNDHDDEHGRTSEQPTSATASDSSRESNYKSTHSTIRRVHAKYDTEPVRNTTSIGSGRQGARDRSRRRSVQQVENFQVYTLFRPVRDTSQQNSPLVLTDAQFNVLVDRLVDRLEDNIGERLIDELSEALVERLANRLADHLNDRLFNAIAHEEDVAHRSLSPPQPPPPGQQLKQPTQPKLVVHNRNMIPQNGGNTAKQQLMEQKQQQASGRQSGAKYMVSKGMCSSTIPPPPLPPKQSSLQSCLDASPSKEPSFGTAGFKTGTQLKQMHPQHSLRQVGKVESLQMKEGVCKYYEASAPNDRLQTNFRFYKFVKSLPKGDEKDFLNGLKSNTSSPNRRAESLEKEPSEPYPQP